MVRVSHGDEESSWAPEAEAAAAAEQEVQEDGTSTKVEATDSSDQWQPKWPDTSNAAFHSTGNPDLSAPYDLSATHRRRDQYAAAVAMAITPDDLFSVSTASANQTARTSNKSHSPSNSAYDSPLDVRHVNGGVVEDAADDTSSAYFARSPFTIAPITPSSTVMSYSSSDMEGTVRSVRARQARATTTSIDRVSFRVGCERSTERQLLRSLIGSAAGHSNEETEEGIAWTTAA